MSTTPTLMRVRLNTPKFEVIWFDGKNGTDVAQFLQSNGKRCELEFHTYGTNLKLNGSKVDVPKDQGGIWIGSDGKVYTKQQVDETLEVISLR